MERLLRSIEAYIAPGVDDQADPLPAFTAPAGPARLDLRRAGITTVIWATGYRQAYSGCVCRSWTGTARLTTAAA